MIILQYTRLSGLFRFTCIFHGVAPIRKRLSGEPFLNQLYYKRMQFLGIYRRNLEAI